MLNGKPSTQSVVQPDPPLTELLLLKERYQILQPLSRGSFGETFIAIDTHRPSQPQCVVKRFDPIQIRDENALIRARQRFDQEAAILEQLGHHDQIPRLLAHFEVKGEFYLVQEFVPGLPLQAMLTEAPQWPVKTVFKWLAEILEILTFLHSQKVIHRDIKPDNLILRESDQRWVLIDFGAVKQQSPAVTAPDPGYQTMAIYSEGYTPSEQLEGNPCPASDLYALGMVAMQCLTGQYPNIFKRHLREQGLGWLTPITESYDLAEILVNMTYADCKARYQTAQAVLQDLNNILPRQLESPDTEQTSPDGEQASLPEPPGNAQLSRAESPETAPKGPIATKIFQPPPPPQALKIELPTQLLSPKQSLPNEPLPSEQLNPLADPLSDSEPTDQPSTQFWSKLPIQQTQAFLWRGLNRLNIYRLQEALIFIICVGVLLGVGSTMTHMVAATLLFPPPKIETPTQPATADGLVATLSGNAEISKLAITPDGRTLFSADATGEITAWDLASQQPTQSFTSAGKITALAMSRDGTYLASGNEYANIQLWHLLSGKLLHTLRSHQLPVSALTFKSDGTTLAAASEDRQLIHWSLKTKDPSPTPKEVNSSIKALEFSLDGQYLIGGSANYTITVWNAHTGNLIRTLAGHSGTIRDIAISPNGAVLVSASEDNTIKVWNLATGKLISTLTGHFGAVNAIAFGSNSQILASGSEDGTVWLWDIYSGRVIRKLSNFQGSISDIVISPNGQLLASSTNTGKISLWQISQENNP